MKFICTLIALFLISELKADTRIFFTSTANIYNPATTFLTNVPDPDWVNITYDNYMPKLNPSIIISSPFIGTFSIKVTGALKLMSDGDACNFHQNLWAYPGKNPPDPGECGSSSGLVSTSKLRLTYLDSSNKKAQIEYNYSSGAMGSLAPAEFKEVTPKINSPIVISMYDFKGSMGIPYKESDGIGLYLNSYIAASPDNSGHLKMTFSGQIDISCFSCTPGQFNIAGGILYTSKRTAASGFKFWPNAVNQTFSEREEYIPINFSNARF